MCWYTNHEESHANLCTGWEKVGGMYRQVPKVILHFPRVLKLPDNDEELADLKSYCHLPESSRAKHLPLSQPIHSSAPSKTGTMFQKPKFIEKYNFWAMGLLIVI